MQNELWATLLASYRAGSAGRRATRAPRALHTYTELMPRLLARPVLLVSACLLGYAVSYRGECAMCARPRAAASPADFLLRVLGGAAEGMTCVPLCPEVQLLGLSVPRAPLRLVRGEGGMDLVDTGTSRSLFTCNTDDDLSSLLALPVHSPCQAASCTACHMASHASLLPPCKVTRRTLRAVRHTLPLYIDGVVLKARSPCCGVGDARVYGRNIEASSYQLSDGCFTAALRRTLHSAAAAPALPPLVVTSERMLCGYEAGTSPSHCLPTFLAHVRAHYKARRALHAATSRR